MPNKDENMKPTLARRFFRLPVLTIIGIGVFVIFLIIAIADGIVAAAYEFSHAFDRFFAVYFYIPVGSLVLVILGVILHYNSRKKKSMKTEAKVEEPKTTLEQEPAPDTKEETPVEEAKTQDDAAQQKE